MSTETRSPEVWVDIDSVLSPQSTFRPRSTRIADLDQLSGLADFLGGLGQAGIQTGSLMTHRPRPRHAKGVLASFGDIPDLQINPSEHGGGIVVARNRREAAARAVEVTRDRGLLVIVGEGASRLARAVYYEAQYVARRFGESHRPVSIGVVGDTGAAKHIIDSLDRCEGNPGHHLDAEPSVMIYGQVPDQEGLALGYSVGVFSVEALSRDRGTKVGAAVVERSKLVLPGFLA